MNRLRELRNKRGWTQEYLGAKLNVQKSAISKYEIGRTSLSDELIAQLCQIFECSADYLLGLSNTYNCNLCQTSLTQEKRVFQKALQGTTLLSGKGELLPECEEIITDFLSQNATFLTILTQSKN